MRMTKPTDILSLPNELFLNFIFIYLHSTDLFHTFGQLNNVRFNALLSTHIRHIDLSTTDTRAASIDRWLSYFSSVKTNRIFSLRINVDHFDNLHLSSIFPRLNRLDLRMTRVSEKVSQMIDSTRIKFLSITLISNEPERIQGLVSSVWHPNSCLERLSTSNCFIFDKSDLSSLLINRNLTHLSLDLVHISLAVVLMPFVPALEHFELRLHHVDKQLSVFPSTFLEKRVEWPRKVQSLRLIAYDQLMDTNSFCAFVRRFCSSLDSLSFYFGTPQRFLMSGWRKLEEHLLDSIPHLKHIEFCVHSGMINMENDRRRNFDRWTKKEVISIFHSQQFLTRFTMPYAFDRLDYVSNDFLDYHCNFRQSNNALSFPAIRMITFATFDKLTLALFAFIRQTCSFLRHLRFKKYCHLNDDLIQNTTLTLTTVTELSLSDVPSTVDFSVLCRLLSLLPNLKQLTAQRHHITVIDNINNDAFVLRHIMEVKIVE